MVGCAPTIIEETHNSDRGNKKIEKYSFLAIYLNFYELFTNNRKVDTEEA